MVPHTQLPQNEGVSSIATRQRVMGRAGIGARSILHETLSRIFAVCFRRGAGLCRRASLEFLFIRSERGPQRSAVNVPAFTGTFATCKQHSCMQQLEWDSGIREEVIWLMSEWSLCGFSLRGVVGRSTPSIGNPEDVPHSDAFWVQTFIGGETLYG